jgi:hypothetical protein
MSRRSIRRKIRLDDAEPSQRVIRAYIRRLPKNPDHLFAYWVAAWVGCGAAFACAFLGLFLGIELLKFWPWVAGAAAVALPVVAVASARFYLARNDNFAPGPVYLSHWNTAKKPKLPCGKVNDLWLCWRLGSYNYLKLYRSVQDGEWEDRKGRRELRRLCEAATVELLRLDVVGLGPGNLPAGAKVQLDRDFARARELTEVLKQAPARREAAAQARTEMLARPAREAAEVLKAEAQDAALTALMARGEKVNLIGDEPAQTDVIIAEAAAENALIKFMRSNHA